MVLAGMKPVELREAVAIQPDRLAIKHEGLGPQPSSSLADQWEAVRPIEAPARTVALVGRPAARSGGNRPV
jgi:hypothetical protein